MRARSAGRSLGAGGRRMADAVLFEFLHTEMVAELWAHDPDSGPGGQNMSLSVLEGMGFRVGQALGERNPAWLPPSSSPWAPQAWPGDPPASAWPKCLPLPPRLSRETLAYREELDILKFLCKDLWMAVFQKQMDSLRTNHQASPLPRGPTSCRTTVSPSSSGWPRACSIWRKHPSSWPSPAASCVAPSAPWASRAWSPPPWQPCLPVSSRW
ncbi:trafficking protein particle complex subunit 6A isoform X2 [Equus przewalskii]|uniref:Trafficking protein particle complex subunit 6A isoform X2 n=1 Tax=Equus przewalskii TaxID=9798 RepID=A0ABM4QHX2_EQUPR